MGNIFFNTFGVDVAAIAQQPVAVSCADVVKQGDSLLQPVLGRAGALQYGLLIDATTSSSAASVLSAERLLPDRPSRWAPSYRTQSNRFLPPLLPLPNHDVPVPHAAHPAPSCNQMKNSRFHHRLERENVLDSTSSPPICYREAYTPGRVPTVSTSDSIISRMLVALTLV